MRLAHRVKELDKLPHNLSDMPSIKKVRNWYAQSFEVRPFPRSSPRSSSHTPSQELISFPPVVLPPDIRQALMVPRPENSLPESTPNLALRHFNDPALHASNAPSNGFNKLKLRVPMERRCPPSPFPPCLSSVSSLLPLTHRYYADTDNIVWPPQVQDYNKRFTKVLETIKTRHDPTVTTVAQGVLEWKRRRNAQHIGLDIQAWLDRFYMSRIGIRFLIGQREPPLPPPPPPCACPRAEG